MIPLSSALWKRLAIGLPIVIGVLEIVAAVIMLLLAALLGSDSTREASWPTQLLSHGGVGLLAAGVVTVALEPLTRSRHFEDIEEIKRAHAESILRDLMPEAIFSAIRTQIIQRPCVRRDVKVTYDFEWADAQRDKVRTCWTSAYDVANVSQAETTYVVHVIAERDTSPELRDATAIEQIVIHRHGKEPVRYSKADLADIADDSPQTVQVRLPLAMAPGETVHVEVVARSTLLDHIKTCVMSGPTSNFDLTVTHPPDMVVRAYALHPIQSQFMVGLGTGRSKHWRIAGGLLPFQGIEISYGRDDSGIQVELQEPARGTATLATPQVVEDGLPHGSPN